MCIERTGRYKVNDPGEGWKVFFVHQSGSFGGDFYNQRQTRPLQRWLKADSFRDKDIERPSTGWHVFQREKDAQDWKWSGDCPEVLTPGYYFVSKVKYKGVRRRGYQTTKRVFTADEIYIPKPKTKKESK